MFFKLFWHDFKAGTLRRSVYWVFTALLFGFAAFRTVYVVHHYNDAFGTMRAVGLGDVFLESFGGVRFTLPGSGDFKMPILWLCFYILSAFFSLSYPLQDLLGIGQNVLVRNKKRTEWWLGKLFWVVSHTLIYFIVAYGISVLLGWIMGGELNLLIHREALNNAAAFYLNDSVLATHFASAWLLTFILSCVLNVMQLTLSLFVPLALSFGTVVLLLLLPIVVQAPWAFTNFGMPVRLTTLVEEGLNPSTGFIILGSILVALLIIGLLRFKHFDIVAGKVQE